MGKSARGKVYLVGAGPGDLGLITVRGLELVKRADAVVYDYLSSGDFLDCVREDAEVFYVGKKGFGEHVSQAEINELLVRLATEGAPGRVIVRLKGGDPFVFGRGGEEALALAEHKIPFEVVPGVTSGLAAPMYAGVPVTQRKVASSVTLVTGHEDPTREETGVDWPALAALVRRGNTVCFYMGMRTLPEISGRLLEEGADASTPAALVRWGTTSHQETLVATLGTVAEEAERARFASPAIIVVGQVVSYRGKLSWFERLPLFGRTIAVTRSRAQAGDFVRQLESRGADVHAFPVIDFSCPDSFEGLDRGIERLATYDWVVFTSANGAERFFDRLARVHGGDARSFGGAKIAAIGPATSRALEAHGIRADAVPQQYRAEGVFEAIRASVGEGALSGARVLIPRAQTARETLPEMLRAAGAIVDVAAAYKTVLPERSRVEELVGLLERGEVDALPFTASSTARNLVELLGKRAKELLGDVDLFSIGPVTSETLHDFGLRVAAQAEEYTIPGLVSAIEGYYRMWHQGSPLR